ncbi:MAG TPA: YggT family protein [Candidatus Saccharimonadales bacterium]|nr:YggT family protein [Candidatus Saccharimonadales bacterium]
MEDNVKVEAEKVATPAQQTVVPKSAFKTYQIIYYILGIIEILLGFRFVLKLLGANPTGFVSFIYSLSGVFMAPFRAVFPTAAQGGNVLEWSVALAAVVYLVVAWGLASLLKIVTEKHVA